MTDAQSFAEHDPSGRACALAGRFSLGLETDRSVACPACLQVLSEPLLADCGRCGGRDTLTIFPSNYAVCSTCSSFVRGD